MHERDMHNVLALCPWNLQGRNRHRAVSGVPLKYVSQRPRSVRAEQLRAVPGQVLDQRRLWSEQSAGVRL